VKTKFGAVYESINRPEDLLKLLTSLPSLNPAEKTATASQNGDK
jgi:hypothetical protein